MYIVEQSAISFGSILYWTLTRHERKNAKLTKEIFSKKNGKTTVEKKLSLLCLIVALTSFQSEPLPEAFQDFILDKEQALDKEPLDEPLEPPDPIEGLCEFVGAVLVAVGPR